MTVCVRVDGVCVCARVQEVPNNMSQVVMFAAADIVISAHGAGLANIQFTGPHGALLEIAGPHFAAGPMSVLPGSGGTYHQRLDRCAFVWALVTLQGHCWTWPGCATVSVGGGACVF